MQLTDAIRNRRGIKRYHHKKPDWRKILKAIDMARLCPNAGGQFVMKFILVSNEGKIARITQATQQSFVGTAKYLVVAISDDSKLKRFYGERGTRYSSLQAGAAIENFLLALEEQELVTYWVRYFHDGQIKDILGIPETMSVEGIFPIGVGTSLKAPEERSVALENITYFDSWGNKKMTPEERVSVEAV